MIVELTPTLAGHIAARLRARDRAEVLALLPKRLDLVQWATSLFDPADRALWAACAADGEPVAMGGIHRHADLPHLATTWAVGTDRKLEAGADIFRCARRLHEEWSQKGVMRFQCLCLDTPEESSEWLERLGYTREGLMPGLGHQGETFLMWGNVYGC